MNIEAYLESRGISHDPVNHPSHYETGKFECIEVMEEALGRNSVKCFCICNAFKYLYRAQRKNNDEDIFKAQWYLNKWAELTKKDDADWRAISDEEGGEEEKEELDIPYVATSVKDSCGPKVSLKTIADATGKGEQL